MNTEKDDLPDFTGKCISIIIKDDSTNHDLCNPHFEYQGGRLFIVGTIPKGSTESNWNANSSGAVAWDRVTDYTLFNDEASYTKAIKIAEEFEEKKDKKK